MSDAVGWHGQNADKFAANYARSRAFREREQVWRGLIEAYARPDSAVLDAGCGSGIFSFIAAERARNVTAFDGSVEMIALCEARKQALGARNVTFSLARLENELAQAGPAYDLVLCSSVLEYLADYLAAIDALAARLKPDGVLIFSMPNGASLYRRLEAAAHALTGRPAYYAHVRHVPRLPAVQAGLAQRGLKVLSFQTYAATPLLSPAVRALGRKELGDTMFVIVARRQT